MGLEHLVEERAHAHHRIQGVEGALDHDRDLGPPHATKRRLIGLDEVNELVGPALAGGTNVEERRTASDHARGAQQPRKPVDQR